MDLLPALLPALRNAAGRTLSPANLDLIVVHNTGPIPAGSRAHHEGVGAPGFNVVVAERGLPVFFCKCRPPGDPALAHEATIGGVVARDPSSAGHVASFHLERGDVMDVLVVQRLPGRPYHELLVKQDDAEWLGCVESIVALVETMSDGVAAAIPALLGPANVVLSDEGRWGLSILETDHGIAQSHVRALADALAQGGVVTPRLQHADLWPPNVLIDGSALYVLDLELFGRVRIPLYDLLHMLHVGSVVRHSRTDATRSWIERLVDGVRGEEGARKLITRAADRHALSPAATLGALVYYLVDMGARIRARGAWSADWRQYALQAVALAERILNGTATPDRLFTAGRG
jgi:hypothetical protein